MWMEMDPTQKADIYFVFQKFSCYWQEQVHMFWNFGKIMW